MKWSEGNLVGNKADTVNDASSHRDRNELWRQDCGCVASQMGVEAMLWEEATVEAWGSC